MRDLKLDHGIWQLDESIFLGRSGGFGAVHPGASQIGGPVAIKMLHKNVGHLGDRELVFARGFAGLQTRHIIPILDCGTDPATGRQCIVMARADGSLSDYLSQHPHPTETDIAEVLIQIAGGLIEANDWVHRDLKPANVLRYDGRWHVADFGIARLATANTSINTLKDSLTPPYAAPEQWRSERATHATDVYALGCIGVRLLTGTPPFSGPSFDDYSKQHTMDPVQIGSGSPRLRGILVRMLAKPPVGRPSLERVTEDLQAFIRRPEGSGIGGQQLAAAASAAAEEAARREAIEAERESKRIERKELSEHGFSMLEGIAERLFAEIREHAPQAKLFQSARQGRQFSDSYRQELIAKGQLREMKGKNTHTAELGSGKLTMSIRQFHDFAPELFTNCKWDVVCGDAITITSPACERSASLWFGNIESQGYAWYEVAYWSMRGDHNKMPRALQPSQDADYAAAPVVHSWHLANKPRRIETEEEIDAFCQRWMSYLSRAAQGTLTPPSRLPEDH